MPLHFSTSWRCILLRPTSFFFSLAEKTEAIKKCIAKNLDF